MGSRPCSRRRGAHAEARGFRVLAAAGVESESHLPFAGLHRLLLPVLDEVDRLPASLREAIRAVFGLTDEAAPSPFLIALAILHLLGEGAARAPVLLLVDDAHWIDHPTADVGAGRDLLPARQGSLARDGLAPDCPHRHGFPGGISLEFRASRP